jgi:MoaD family protein
LNGHSWDESGRGSPASLPSKMKVLIPTPLRQYTGKQASVDVAATTVSEMLSELTSQYPELRKQLFTDDGKLRRFVNVYVNDEDIRYLEQENTTVNQDDTISIVPSVAGGRSHGCR